MSSACVLDFAALVARAGGDEELATELLDEFVMLVTVKMSDVHAAMATRECRAITARAHALHGLLLTIGANDAATSANRFEIKSVVDVPTTHDLDELQRNVDASIDEARRISTTRKTSAIKTMTAIAGTRAA